MALTPACATAGTGGQMVTPPDETTTDPYAVIAALRAERDAALARETALAHYVARDVSSLTGGKQNPDMEVRFDTKVFAVGLQCEPRCGPPAPKCGSLIHLFLRPPPVIPG